MNENFKDEEAALEAFVQLINQLERIDDTEELPFSVRDELDIAKRNSTYGKRVWRRYIEDSTDSYVETLEALRNLPIGAVIRDKSGNDRVKCRAYPGLSDTGWALVEHPGSLRDEEYVLRNYGPIMVLPDEDKEN